MASVVIKPITNSTETLKNVEKLDSHCARRSRRRRKNSVMYQNPSISDASSYLDISLPSMVNGYPVKAEQVETFLQSHGYRTQKILYLRKYENFHRWTVSFDNEQGKRKNDMQFIY